MCKRFIYPTVLFLLLIAPVIARAADTLKIDLVYKHKLDEAGRTNGYVTIQQKFYTPDRILFRKITYDEQNGQINGYTFYFYQNDGLNTDECYDAHDSLKYIARHIFNHGLETEVDTLKPVSDGLKITHRMIRKYGSGGHVKEEKEYTGKKVVSTVICKYNPQGLLTLERRKGKTTDGKPAISEERTYFYNPDKSIHKVLITGKDMANHTYKRTEEYVYNEQGKLASVTLSGDEYPEDLIRTYKYSTSGALSIYQESTSSGKITLLLQYDYKKHYMNPGTQVSYFTKYPGIRVY